MSLDQNPGDGRGFYVGYLPVPAAHKQFLSKIIVFLFVGMMCIGVLIATTQRNPGQTDVVSAEMAAWSGTVYTDPYPMLVNDDGSIHLLIGIGKFGVLDRVIPFEGMRCEVNGWALARDDRRAIQLDLSEEAIKAIPGAVNPLPIKTANSSRHVDLIGEIVDGKCFLGAMKPGDGKGHKACATLCIQGGLPSLFASQNPMPQLPLVIVDGSAELPEKILELVGEPVQISGEMSQFGSLVVLNVNSNNIQRWSGDTP